MGCFVSKREHQRIRIQQELKQLKKEREKLIMEVNAFINAKQDSIADRKRLYDSETENAVLRKQLQGVSMEMSKLAEDLNVKLLIIGVDV